jgi:hypothetical protein
VGRPDFFPGIAAFFDRFSGLVRSSLWKRLVCRDLCYSFSVQDSVSINLISPPGVVVFEGKADKRVFSLNITP